MWSWSRNDNPKIVVMDRRAYDRIIRLAWAGVGEVGGQESLDGTEKSIRKVNSNLMREYEERVDQVARRHQEEVDKTRILLRDYTGKEVYLVGSSVIWTPQTLVGPSPTSDVHVVVDVKGHVHISNIRTEIPEGWTLVGAGHQWEGCWVHPAAGLSRFRRP